MLRSPIVGSSDEHVCTCPIFRSQRDAELTKQIYRIRPVLIREIYDEEGNQVGEENPWDIDFMLMFMMNTDSHLFRTRQDLEEGGFRLTQPGSRIVKGEQLYLPLYEGKMVWQFDHRFASVAGSVSTDRAIGAGAETDERQHTSATYSTLPRYWVPSSEPINRLNRCVGRATGCCPIEGSPTPQTCAQSYVLYSRCLVTQMEILLFWLGTLLCLHSQPAYVPT